MGFISAGSDRLQSVAMVLLYAHALELPRDDLDSHGSLLLAVEPTVRDWT